MVEAVAEAEAFEQRLRAFAALGARLPGVGRGDLDVADRIEDREQMVALEDEAEMLAPQRREGVGRKLV